jgi:ribonuclease P protein component
VVGRYLVLFALASEDEMCRFGITASRKVGGAVVRNRARRRVRELFRNHGEVMSGWHGDLVVNVRWGCDGVGWEKLTEDFERCMRRAKAAPRAPAR